MKKENVEKVIRETYLLELGVDFQEQDLEVVAGYGENVLKCLTLNFRQNFYKFNIGELVWSGHFDKETKTVKVQTEILLFN